MSGRCKACGKDFRKGVLVSLLEPGGLQRVRVCQGCAGAGVVIVAPKIAPVVKQEHAAPDGVDRALRTLRTFAAAARASAKVKPPAALKSSEDAGLAREDIAQMLGRAEGLESAIEAIKRECGGAS